MGRRVVWSDDSLHRLSDHGHVDLNPVELEDVNDDETISQLSQASVYTWNFDSGEGANSSFSA